MGKPVCSKEGSSRATEQRTREGEGRRADLRRCQIHTELAGLDPVDHRFKICSKQGEFSGNEGSLSKLHGLLSCSSHPRAFVPLCTVNG